MEYEKKMTKHKKEQKGGKSTTIIYRGRDTHIQPHQIP